MPSFCDGERVEVLKGPQGTLYGRNSTAGVINVLTRDPGKDLDGYVTAELGSYERYRIEGAVGGAITQDISARIAVLRERSEEHTSELQSLMRISYAALCLKKKKNQE